MEKAEEESNGTGRDGGRRGRVSSWGEEAELTHKGGPCFISREKGSHESCASASPIDPERLRACSRRGFVCLRSLLTHTEQAGSCEVKYTGG